MSRPSAATGRLHRAPFSAWLNRYIATHGDLATAAVRLGMDPSGLSRHVSGQTRLTPWMQLEAVDHVLTAAEAPHMLAILYPQDIDMRDCWCPTCREIVTIADDGRCPWCEHQIDPPPRPRPRPLGRSSERTRAAKRLRAQGMRYRDIAAALGVAKSTVHGYIHSSEDA